LEIFIVSKRKGDGSVADFRKRFFVDAVLVFGGEHLAGDLRGGGGDKAAELALEFRGDALAVGVSGCLGLREDLLGLGDGFLGFLLGKGGCAFPGLGDEADGIFVRLGDGRGCGRLGFGELLLDALELFLTLKDAGAALLEDRLDRAEGEFLQDEDHQEKVDYLRRKESPMESEGGLYGFKSARLLGDCGEIGKHNGENR
jgi:hypothetical protein